MKYSIGLYLYLQWFIEHCLYQNYNSIFFTIGLHLFCFNATDSLYISDQVLLELYLSFNEATVKMISDNENETISKDSLSSCVFFGSQLRSFDKLDNSNEYLESACTYSR